MPLVLPFHPDTEEEGRRRAWISARHVKNYPRIKADDLAHENKYGAAAELAASAYLKMPLAPWTGHGDRGYDFHTLAGRLDVKGAAKWPFGLGVKNADLTKEGELFAIAHVVWNVSVTFLYWCWAADMVTYGEPWDPNPLHVPATKLMKGSPYLHPIETLLPRLRGEKPAPESNYSRMVQAHEIRWTMDWRNDAEQV